MSGVLAAVRNAVARTLLGLTGDEVRYTFDDVRSEIRAVRAELKEEIAALRREVAEQRPSGTDRVKGMELPVGEA
jgi:hypothetical protein